MPCQTVLAIHGQRSLKLECVLLIPAYDDILFDNSSRRIQGF